MAAIDLKNTTVWICDGGSQSIEVTIGEGTLKYTEHQAVTYVKNKGALDTVKLGDEEPLDVSFEFTWEFLSSTGSASPFGVEDILKNTGGSFTSTSNDTCEPHCVDIVVVNNPGCAGSNDVEQYRFKHFRWESLDHDIKNSQVSVSGKCNCTLAEITATSLVTEEASTPPS